MSVIGGPNNPISNGLVYALDFKNNRCYVSGSNSAKSLTFATATATVTGSNIYQIPNIINGLLQFNVGSSATTGSWVQIPTVFDAINSLGQFTILVTAEGKNDNNFLSDTSDTAYTRWGAALGSQIGLGFGQGQSTQYGRGFSNPATSLSHIVYRYSSGSFTTYVNGIPISSSNTSFSQNRSQAGTSFFISGRHFQQDSLWSGSLGNIYIYNRALTNDEIRTNYTLASREYGLPTPPSFSIDENAYLFSQTAGITSSAYISALDTFVRGLKSASLWDKMVGIYPFLGGNNTLNQLNLKESSLTVYPASFTGSWSSSFSGSRSNTTASFATLTGLTPSTYYPSISSQSIHLSYLSYDTPASGGYLMGVEQLPGLPGDIATPAAAYSVRKVRTAYTGSAMTVRRDFDDVTFDVGFDASGNLNTGSLLTNMTASGIVTTLPGDYSGLAAAYSLRRVSSSYTGYAIEARRAVDNYSASIGFDGSGNLNTASLASFIRTGSETPISAYSGLAVAYSLRKVVPGYTGSAIEVQSGSVSQSIGFNSFGDLDVTAIRTFAGSGDAFVRTWFDQSGNGYNATQGTLAVQAKIYSGSLGTVVTQGGKPAISFTDVTTMNIGGLPSSSNYNDFWVLQTTDTGFMPLISNFGNRFSWVASSGSTLNYFYEQFGTPALYKNSTLSTPTTRGSVYTAFNGYNLIHTAGANTTTWTANWQLAGYSPPFGLIANLQEILIYTASVSANRTYIENNINSYYGIYTPSSVSTENAFVKTWYDQSGNNRHATQSVDANQPQIVSNGSYIGYLNMDGKLLEAPSGYINGNKYSHFQVVQTNGNAVLSATSKTGNTYYGVASGDGGTSANGNFTSVSYYDNGILLPGTSRADILTATQGSFNLLTSFVTSTDTANIRIGYAGNGTFDAYFIKEQVLYASELTSSRGLIEDNINGYYNIFTQSLASGSGYVTRWYDQSGNNRHATQSVAGNQPLILSSGSINLVNTKPGVYFGYQGTVASVKLATPAFAVGISSPFTVFTTFQTTLESSQTIYDGLATNIRFNYNATGYNLYNDDNINGVLYGTGTTNQQTHFNLWGTQLQGAQNTASITTGATRTVTLDGISLGHLSNPSISTAYQFQGSLQEVIFYASNQTSNRAPFQQNINSYFNIYTPLGYNLNTNSLSLFSSPNTVAGAANNVASASFTTGGPLGLITVSRTGSSNYTLWKNKVPNRVAISPSIPQTSSLFLNAANLNNALFSSSQNNIGYASVGAGLSDTEASTYYDLVNTFQTSLGRGVSNPNAFITTWDTRISGTGTVSNTSSIVLPLFGTQAITASWGDGTTSNISSSTQVDRTHSYATPGIYTVTITGSGQGFQFNNGGDRNKLLDVGQWGSISGSASTVFYGCTNLVGTAPDPHVLQTTNLSNYFTDASKFNGFLNNWRPISCSFFTSMFQGATVFNQPIGSWPLSASNIDMSYMFNRASSFNQDLGSWDMSRVTNIEGLFYRAFAFNNGGSSAINNWRFPTSSTVNMREVFFDTDVFNQNIGAWNVEKVTSMYGMFSNNTGFNNGLSPDINNWRPISCSTFVNMFYGATAFNQPIGNWPISASNVSMLQMFVGASAFNQNIGSWDVSKVTNMGLMLYYASAFNNSGSNTINNWRPISCSNFSNMFEGATTFNQPIGNWPISASSVNMSSMFTSNTVFNQNIGSWDVSKVTAMNGMFQSATAFNNSGSSDINNWRPISCSAFNSMFQSAASFNQPIGNWPISASNINMFRMFYGALIFNQDIGSWDVSKVTNMSGMFLNTPAFNNSGSNTINNWRPVSCSNFNSMFLSSPVFNQPINNWPLSASNIDMTGMFSGATAFNQNLGSLNIVNVSNMTTMLDSCGMDKANYSATLTGWASQAPNIKPNVTLGATGRQYDTPGSASRSILTSAPYNWNITGDTFAP
jgi:surface protein